MPASRRFDHTISPFSLIPAKGDPEHSVSTHWQTHAKKPPGLRLGPSVGPGADPDGPMVSEDARIVDLRMELAPGPRVAFTGQVLIENDSLSTKRHVPALPLAASPLSGSLWPTRIIVFNHRALALQVGWDSHGISGITSSRSSHGTSSTGGPRPPHWQAPLSSILCATLILL